MPGQLDARTTRRQEDSAEGCLIESRRISTTMFQIQISAKTKFRICQYGELPRFPPWDFKLCSSFVQNMKKKLRELGLIERYNNDADFALSARCISSLAFVPPRNLDDAIVASARPHARAQIFREHLRWGTHTHQTRWFRDET